MGKKILGWALIIFGIILLIVRMGFGITGFIIWFGIFFTIGLGIALVRGQTEKGAKKE